jgi:nitrile hydratase accessory protein
VTETLPVELDVKGPAAPPRSNGELVFSEPWESRVFGVTVAMCDKGVFEWRAFQAELIAAIRRAEGATTNGEPFHYYVCWLEALEHLLDASGLVEASDARERAASLAERPAGHDHGHYDGHDHGHDDHHAPDHPG